MLSSHAADSVWRSSFNLPQVAFGEVCSAIYLQLSLANVFTLFSARTTGFFCSSPPPSVVLLSALTGAILFAALLAAYWPIKLNEHIQQILDASAFRSDSQYTEVHTRVGVRMIACPTFLIGFTFIYVLVWWVIQDTCKVLLNHLLARYDARHAGEADATAVEGRGVEASAVAVGKDSVTAHPVQLTP